VLYNLSEIRCFFGLVDEIGRDYSTYGEKMNAYGILMGKPEGKIPLGRRRHKWKDNIKMDFRGIGWGVMYWIDVVQ
jgi:hypothetical protein